MPRSAEEVLAPYANVCGWDLDTEHHLLLGFIDRLARADPQVLEDLDSYLEEVSEDELDEAAFWDDEEDEVI